jgi:5-methylcytosine-specific restriction endonuclease McrA
MEEMRLITSGIRRLWTKFSPSRRYLLNSQKKKIPKINKDGTESKVFINVWECSICGELVSERDVDHIDEVGKLPDIEDELPAWVGRLFCDLSNLQIICKDCHKKKTAKNRKPRSKKKCSKTSMEQDALPEKSS